MKGFNMFSRIASIALIISLLLSLMPASLAEFAVTDEERALKSRTESYNGVVEIEGDTYMIYAQNSPEYGDIFIGGGYKTTVKDSACAACTLANILVNMVAFEDLPRIRDLSLFPIRIDTKNVSREQGYFERCSFEIKRNEDYFRYFPLCILNITSSNNKGIGNRHNTAGYYRTFFECLGVENKITYDLEEALEEVSRNNAMVGLCVGGGKNPISRIHGHYLAIAKVKGDKVYFLDSIYTDVYEKDTKGVIHVQEPGVFWVYKDDLDSIGIHGALYIAYTKENRSIYTQEAYDRFIAESNDI